MTTVQFLIDWAIRSSILILCGALLLRVLRVRNSSIRLAAWTAMLCGSLMIPGLNAALPRLPIAVPGTTFPQTSDFLNVHDSASSSAPVVSVSKALSEGNASRSSESWANVIAAIYGFAALALLLRLAVGLAISCTTRDRGPTRLALLGFAKARIGARP
jgi:hypothetical protein